jgi:mitochondrial chaperone BCS1
VIAKCVQNPEINLIGTMCFFPDPTLAAKIGQQLGNYRVSPAAWQNYLQRQNSAEAAVFNCDFAQLQVVD